MTYFKVVFVSSKSLFLTLCGSVITLTLDAVNDIGGMHAADEDNISADRI